MKIYVIEREGRIWDYCTEHETKGHISISAFKSREKALLEARHLWFIFAEKLSGKIPYDDIDGAWTEEKWINVGTDYHNFAIRFTDDCEWMQCEVKFTIRELELND